MGLHWDESLGAVLSLNFTTSTRRAGQPTPSLNPQLPTKSMADYFTNFSLVFSLPSQEAQAYALELAAQASRIQQGDEEPEKIADFIALKTVNRESQFVNHES